MNWETLAQGKAWEGEKMNERRKKELIRIGKFVAFSASAGIIEVLSFTLLNEFAGFTYWPCYLIALVLSVLWNFTLNRNFTFKSASNIPKAMMLVCLFYIVFIPTTTILGNYLAEELGWNEYLVTAMNMGLNITTEYIYDRLVVFRKSIDTKEEKSVDLEQVETGETE